MIDIKEIEGLRNKILQLNSKTPMGTIMVTGSVPGEGCTSVAAGLAKALALNHDTRVLIIDANLGNPGLNDIFGIHGKEGFWELISNGADHRALVNETKDPNLSLMVSGNCEARDTGPPPAPGNLNGAFSALTDEYDYVIIDSPPVNTDSDPHFLAPHVDGVILVVHTGRTRWQVAQAAKNRLDEASANILGVVLNRRKYVIPAFLYERL